MGKVTKIICLLVWSWCIGGYAQGEVISTNWAAMGLKGKVKSVETLLYFAVEKDGVISKGDPFSRGIYPPEKIEINNILKKIGRKAYFIDFLTKITPSVVIFNEKGWVIEKRLFDTVFHRKIVHTYNAENKFSGELVYVRDLLVIKDSYKYNKKGQLEEEILGEEKEASERAICKHLYTVDGQPIENITTNGNGIPKAKEIFTYKDKRLVGIDFYRSGEVTSRASYQYGDDGQLVGCIFQMVPEGWIWDSKFTYDEKGHLKEEYLIINDNKNNGYFNKFAPDGRMLEHLTLSLNYLCKYEYTDDKQGNWVKMITYEQGVPVLYVERKIEYF